MGLPIDPTLVQTRLTAAREAYDRLLTGGLREKVDHNGTSITYSRADASKLKGYIDELEDLLDDASTPKQRRRMIVNQF